MFLDGIRYSIEIADLAYGRLYAWAAQVTKTGEDGKGNDRTVYRGVIGDAWAMIDAVHRLRRLLDNMPRLKRGLAIKGFLAVTKDVSTIRHRVQHLDEQIRTLAQKQLPTWGSVSWFYWPDTSKPRG